jgi:hypothetical protein
MENKNSTISMNTDTDDTANMTVPELKRWLQLRGVNGISKMRRAELLEQVNTCISSNAPILSAQAVEDSKKKKQRGTKRKRATSLDLDQDSDDDDNEEDKLSLERRPLCNWYQQFIGDVAKRDMDQLAFDLVNIVEKLLADEEAEPTAGNGWRHAPFGSQTRSQRVRLRFSWFVRSDDRMGNSSLYRVMPQAIATLTVWPKFLVSSKIHAGKLLETIVLPSLQKYRRSLAYAKKPKTTPPNLLDDLVALYGPLRNAELQKALAQSTPLFAPVRKIVFAYWAPALPVSTGESNDYW